MDSFESDDIRTLPIQNVIGRIICVNGQLAAFWSNARGWAPDEAAALLAKSRLDWQVSLSRCLKFAVRQLMEAPEEEGALILAWVNLGCLVEGTMKLFLSIYRQDYDADADSWKTKDASLIEPDVLEFERLRQFFEKRGLFSDRFRPFVKRVQQRRNGVHAFRDRDIGSPEGFLDDVRNYMDFLNDVTGGLPYPDEPR
jgi:hypothetical protein